MMRFNFLIFLLYNFVYKLNAIAAPILDIDNESIGYIGTIGERNVLVDLKPHLQIRNIDSINGICSYHVFKPTSEEFPFTIDIKDKTTGEAIIELIRKDSEKANFLDCTKRKHYDFLIQAHDCSTPSVPSNKVPVKIEVLDHDDFKLKFEQEGLYQKVLIESDEIYENFLTIRARDNDCTNDGYACHYQLLNENLIPVDPLFPFKIDTIGQLSSVRSVKRGEQFNFVTRAFDCLNNNSYVDAKVSISVNEPCLPQWTISQSEINTHEEKTLILPNIQFNICDDHISLHKPDSECLIDSVEAKLSLALDPTIKTNCQKCDLIQPTGKLTLFNGRNEPNADDDSDEDDSEDDYTNQILPPGLKEPENYQTFLKTNGKSKKIDFSGEFGSEFTLSAWIRRPKNADKTIKEQVLCGTDSKTMNRHHYGLYFYRGNLKFLLRREPNEHTNTNDKDLNQDSSNIDSNEAFYPSLWEWSLYEPFVSDSKWHLYEIKFSYPNASLFIDGVKFVENSTNSDIIDAYELNDAGDTGDIVSYIGACYHARTQALTDYFEGDIGPIVLVKKRDEKKLEEEKLKCKSKCGEFLDAGSGNILEAIDSSNELILRASNFNEMSDLIKKVSYFNKDSNSQSGSRSIKLSTNIHCKNNGKNIELKDIDIKLNLKHKKREFKVILQGDRQITVTKTDLENGFEPFKDILITKIDDNIDSDDSDESSTETKTTTTQSIQLSSCQVKIIPDRNLMAPSLNNEKVMFLQNLLDEYNFKFEETLNSVFITGLQTIKNYENFIRHLTYVVINVNEVDPNRLELIRNKKFLISCYSADGKKESNMISIGVNLDRTETIKKVNAINLAGPVAHKQLQSFVVSENDDDIIEKKSQASALIKNAPASPMVFALLVMASCAIGFLLVFGAIKMYTSRVLSKRKPLPNEENPPLEWDDSGLNITENPLETLEINKETGQVVHSVEYEEDEYSSYEDEDDEYNEDEQYSSEEEPNKVVERELEWDDTSLEIKLREKQLQLSKSSLSNKLTTSNSNQFV
ncbi:unnamed protein product [Brachionus calyciflorus]|uniref:Calsyntenin C-terminal domain-containing protein n=1 Tax=Brachionus calyciflorus TaxID=104777 RepID=A0A813VP89_9BILA|nr:unnamed protein product [Brachionus calyciflorus]